MKTCKLETGGEVQDTKYFNNIDFDSNNYSITVSRKIYTNKHSCLSSSSKFIFFIGWRMEIVLHSKSLILKVDVRNNFNTKVRRYSLVFYFLCLKIAVEFKWKERQRKGKGSLRVTLSMCDLKTQHFVMCCLFVATFRIY